MWDIIVSFFSQFILYLSQVLNHNYALGIIVFTIITRIVLLPLLQYQMVTSRRTAEIQPEMNRLRQQYASRDRETQMKLNDAIKELHKQHGVNQWAGCLPALLQLPIMLALYQAISTTEELFNGHFLWAELGKPDPIYVLPILAAFFTWLNSYLVLQGQTKEMQQMKFMQLYVLPGMILMFGITMNAALSLYWLVGNIFAVLQTLILNNPFKIKAEREEKIREKRSKERALKKAKERALKRK